MDEPACMACGCTQSDCSECVGRTGDACSWVAPYLCSACVGDVVEIGDRYVVRYRQGRIRQRLKFGPIVAVAMCDDFEAVALCAGEDVPDDALWVYVRADVFDLAKAMAAEGRVQL